MSAACRRAVMRHQRFNPGTRKDFFLLINENVIYRMEHAETCKDVSMGIYAGRRKTEVTVYRTLRRHRLTITDLHTDDTWLKS